MLAVGAWLISWIDKSYLGITIFVPFIHYSLAYYSHAKMLNTDAPMSWFEYFCFMLAYLIQYGWGIVNLQLTYKILDPNVSTLKKGGFYIVVNLIVIPFITSSTAAVLKWLDNKGQFTPFLIAQMVITLIQGIGMLVCAFIFLTWVQGTIISAFIGVMIYIAIQVSIYVKNEYYMPPFWNTLNFILLVLAIISSFVVSLFIPGLHIFLGFSISVWFLCALLLLYGYGNLLIDWVNMQKKPIFYSPWIFPIYKYDPRKQDVVPHNRAAASAIAGLVILIMWSVLASVWITPTHVGVGFSIIAT